METYKIKTEIDTGNSVKDLATLRKELDELAQSGKEGTDEFKKLEEELQKLAYDSSEAGKVLNKFGGTLEQVKGEGVQPLSFAIGELEDRLYEMAAAGLQGTAEFNEMAQEVGRMKQVILETDMQLDGLAMTTTQKVGGALQGVAGGFEVAQGVMSSFGVESEAVEEALLKVQSAMAISQGVQSIKETIPVFHALKAAIASTAIGQKLLAGSSMLAAGAMKVLNFVMSLNPVLLIVTGVGLLVGALAWLIGSTKEAAEENEKLNASIDRQNEAFDRNTENLKRNADNRRRLLIVNGADEEKLHKDTLKRLKEEETNRQKQLRLTEKQLERRRKVLKKAYEEEDEDLIKSIKKQINADRKKYNQLVSNRKEYDIAVKEENKRYKDLTDEEAKEEAEKQKARQEKYASDRKSALDKIRQTEQEYRDTFLSDQEREVVAVQRKYAELIKEAKKFNISTKELENARLNDINEIKSKYASEELKIEEEKQAKLDEFMKQANEQRLQDEEDFNEQYQQAINSDIQNEINAVNEKYFYLIAKAEQYGKDVAELERKQAKELSEINDKYRKEEEEKNKALQQAKYDAVQGGLQALLDLSEAFAGQSEEGQKRAFQFSKAVNIAQATIDTYRSAQTAFASAPNPILGAVFAAIAVASGIANIKKIASTTFEGGSTPSAEGGAGGLGGVITPEFNIVGNSPINQLAELQGQPVQAYVVSGEVTTAQSLDRNRVVNATL